MEISDPKSFKIFTSYAKIYWDPVPRVNFGAKVGLKKDLNVCNGPSPGDFTQQDIIYGPARWGARR